MERFYELRMRNGRYIIVSTNEEGVCQFSINGREFSIYSEGKGNKNLTFSVGDIMDSKEEYENLLVNQDFEVVSLQELDLKKNTEAKIFFRNLKSINTQKYKVKRTFLRWKQNFYFAKHGGIQTPAGWICA